jgi:hypothetical protein
MPLGLAGCGKIPRSPFDKLRATGTETQIISDFPFVLSLSKHKPTFSAACEHAVARRD